MVVAVYISAEAVAPVIISTNSPVMTAWRVRLKRIWYLLIISPAFLEAFCIRGKRIHVSIGLSVVVAIIDFKKMAWDGRRTHVHGVATGRDLAGVTLAESVVEGVGEGVLAEVGKDLLINLESGEVGLIISC